MPSKPRTAKHSVLGSWLWQPKRVDAGARAVRKYMRKSRAKIVRWSEREGWFVRHGGEHDVFKHSAVQGRIIVSRHRELSPGVARRIAKFAGWI